MRILMILIISLATTGALQAATAGLTYERSLLNADMSRAQFEYRGTEQVAVGRLLQLPAARYIAALPDEVESFDLDILVMEADTLGEIDLQMTMADIPTGDLPEYLGMAADHQPYRVTSRQPAWIVDPYEDTGQAYVEIMVFPIAVTEDGLAVFNREVELRWPGSQVIQLNMLKPGDRPACLSKEEPGLALSGASPVYLIVTGAAMFDAMSRLAVYKTSIGLPAEVVLIDNILAEFDGRDDAERLREYLKQFYSEGGQYVLLAGDETVLPLRYVYHFDVSVAVDTSLQQICDLYFADVEGEWEVDGDGVWGEPNADAPNKTPELLVGRLPFSSAVEAEAWVDKLIVYETDPGRGDKDYLKKAYFFCSDQMRDYGGDGQYARISAAYPEHFEVDTASGIEQAAGDDPDPFSMCAADLVDTLDAGFGIVNIVCHGNMNRFEVRTANYNEYPKCWMSTGYPSERDGTVDQLSGNDRVGFYYSLACDNGAFDKDSPPFDGPYINLAQALLAQPAAGAVAMVANTRWGWVGSSYLFQKAFFDSLFANPAQPAVAAFYAAKARYHYYRDAVYGLGFFGDPSMCIHTDLPAELSITTITTAADVQVTLTSNGAPVAGGVVYFSDSSEVLAEAITDAEGHVTFDQTFIPGREYTIAARKPGHVIGYCQYSPGIAADVDDDPSPRPETWALLDNYPNPFNPATTIAFDLARRAHVRLTVFNVLGQIVSEIVDDDLPVGRHSVTWAGTNDDGAEVGSGVYFYRIEAEGFVESRKMVLLR